MTDIDSTTTEQTFTIRGTLGALKTRTVKGKILTQATILHDEKSLLCVWHGRKTLKQDIEYELTGVMQSRNGKDFLADPKVTKLTLVTPVFTAETPAPVVAAQRKKSPFKKILVSSVWGIIGLAIIGSFTSSPASNTNNTTGVSPSTTTASTTQDAGSNASNYSGSTTVDTPNDCVTAAIPYAKTTKTDNTITSGTQKVSTIGSDGQQKTCYPHGRAQPSVMSVSIAPVDEVTSIGTYVAPATPSYSGYTNSAGNYVPSPSTTGGTVGGYNPTAKCRDGTYSYSQSHSGTCSSHGGVLAWL